MTEQTKKLYARMLIGIRRDLERAENAYLRLARLAVEGMTQDRFTPRRRAEMKRCSELCRRLLGSAAEDLALITPACKTEHPAADNMPFIELMEAYHLRLEELEHIADELLKNNGIQYSPTERNNRNQWRAIMENVDFKAEFDRKFAEATVAEKRPNILVAGYTGCGKTSLIRTILGDGIVSENGIDNSKPCRIDFDCYENESIRLWDSRGLEMGHTEAKFSARMREFVSDCQDDPDVDEHIHLVWYLIQGNGARVTDCDLALMKDIFTFDDVIAVVSKKDITKPAQSEAIRKVLAEAGVPDHRIVEVSDAEGGAIGCKELVELSHAMLPEAYRDAFMAAQSIDREAKAAKVAEKRERAQAIIAAAVKAAEECGADDIKAPLTAVLIEMLAKLSALYGLRGGDIRTQTVDFAEKLLDEVFADGGEDSGMRNAGTLAGALGSFMRNNFEAYAVARIKGTPLPELGFDLELFKQFFINYKKGMSMKPNILICGKTGVGKTSLIQAVTHRGVVPDSAIGNGKATTEGFHIYETEIANFIDSEGMNPGTQSVDEYADFILNEVLERLDSEDSDNLIHNIWYCIDGSGARIQDADANLIKTFSDKVLLVVTKCELMRKEQTEAVMNTLLDLLPRERIVFVSAENKTGLAQLIAKAQEMSEQAMDGAGEEIAAFQERCNEYYSNMRENWKASVSDEAESYINWAAGRAAAIALIPLPLADIAPLIANEVYMIYKLAGLYGIAVDNTIVTMLLGSAGGSVVGKIGASFLPFLKVPIAAGVTYGVGKAAKAYFESDMTMDEIELKEKFLEGERAARKLEYKPIEE